jgi:phosphopantothenoylcysteine decarboxylase / phosphopantothenate---cysteine ligase
MHPADEIRGIKSNILAKKKIVLAITGSIAAVETVKLARELIRHGAEVIPVMTHAATKIIHPDSVWFATGKKPIIDLSGDTEHVKYCGNVEDPADLLLISPCTANTISKIAHGIDDSSVTTFASTAIGANHPIIVVPAMHQSMYDHSIVQKNIEVIKSKGIIFIDPFIERNKAKMASIDDIVNYVMRAIGPRDVYKKKILIIGGACCEPIDEVRSICNHSSGKTAVSLAKTAFRRGAEVILWYGISSEVVPAFIEKRNFRSIKEVQQFVINTDLHKYDIIIVCAALSDYIPLKKNEKLSSEMSQLSITLNKADKILPLIRERAEKAILIGFKLDINEKTVIQKAQKMKSQYALDLVIGNTISAINSTTTNAWILKGSNIIPITATKQEVSEALFDMIISK